MLILRWLASQALKAREILSLLGISLFCLWLSNLPIEAQRRWRNGVATTVLYPIHLVVERMHVRVGLEKTIGELESENAKLLVENAKLSEIADIRQELSEFEPMRSRVEFPLIGARVISRDPVRLGDCGSWTKAARADWRKEWRSFPPEESLDGSFRSCPGMRRCKVSPIPTAAWRSFPEGVGTLESSTRRMAPVSSSSSVSPPIFEWATAWSPGEPAGSSREGCRWGASRRSRAPRRTSFATRVSSPSKTRGRSGTCSSCSDRPRCG